MIELRIEEYCHDCPDFEADVTTTKDIFEGRYDPVAGEHKDWAYVRTTIRCAHANRCRAVKRYLEKQRPTYTGPNQPSIECSKGD